MGTGRKFHKKPVTRPKKSPSDRKRRETNHRKRLVALGADEEVVRKMTPKAVRDKLKRPNRTAAELATAKA